MMGFMLLNVINEILVFLLSDEGQEPSHLEA